MVPAADYYGIYQRENGYMLMGARDGRPFLKELDWSYDKKKIDRYLELATKFGN